MDAKFHPYSKALLFNYRIVYRNKRLEIHHKLFADK